MRNYQQIYTDILCENSSDLRRIGIFPGAFKPPHVGHFETALSACKNNDIVYIIVSTKSRAISSSNVSKDTKIELKKPTSCDDGDRYKSFFNSDKYTNNILSVKPAPCARMTSASDLRAAMAIKDKNTVINNLPDGVDSNRILDILMMSSDVSNPNFGYVTFEQSFEIWNIYKELLITRSGLKQDDIKIIKSEITPVRDTYDIVSDINNSDRAGNTVISLYVGT